MTAVVLRLYVAGSSPNSQLARKNLEAVLESLGLREVALEIIDVLEEPLRGLEDGVLVTPTLVRSSPPPVRRVIGNLSQHEVLRASLAVTDG